jgi:hypothetical protein
LFGDEKIMTALRQSYRSTSDYFFVKTIDLPSLVRNEDLVHVKLALLSVLCFSLHQAVIHNAEDAETAEHTANPIDLN